MTTLTVEINKDQDLSAIKDFIAKLGLNYEVEQNEGLVYTDEVKQTLDKRYADYKAGNVTMVSADESKKQIETLFAGKK